MKLFIKFKALETTTRLYCSQKKLHKNYKTKQGQLGPTQTKNVKFKK
jgi:hypothetical protein